jgi:hypothetical protein
VMGMSCVVVISSTEPTGTYHSKAVVDVSVKSQ